MTRVYVAGASKEMPRVEAAIAAVRYAGGEITEDWPAAIRAAGAANEGLTQAQRTEAAVADLRGVETADVVWLMVPEAQTAGAWVEMGYAIALGRRVIVSPVANRCIFGALCEEYATDEDAMREVVRTIGERSAL
jgi:nucleoside 2-deoxyribosyltransferase